MGDKSMFAPSVYARKSGPSGPNRKRYKRICLWCGNTFPTSRPDAKTCKVAHRVALARYVKEHGQPPLFPFGVKPHAKRKVR